MFHLAGETVISLPKPDIDVISLELNEENQGSARVINEHESQGAVDTTLLEALQEFLERNTYRYSLNGSETERLLELLFNYKHVFSISDGDLGTTHMVQHRIETGNALPIRIQPWQTSPWKHGEIERQVTNLIQQGKAKKSSRPWSFTVVLATKKHGSQRLCVDNRQLNAVILKDSFPLPRFGDFLAAFSGL